MATNFVAKGHTMTLKALGDTLSGELVTVEDTVGVAAHDAKSGEVLTIKLDGVFNLPKDSNAAAQGKTAWLAGSTVTATPSGVAIGIFLDGATDEDDFASVRLNGTPTVAFAG